jgi:hypothetical protein
MDSLSVYEQAARVPIDRMWLFDCREGRLKDLFSAETEQQKSHERMPVASVDDLKAEIIC